MEKTTATQAEILSAAALRPDGSLDPMPPRIKGGARINALRPLLSRGLATERAGGVFITREGLRAVGMDPGGAGPSIPRDGTKLALLLSMLLRPGGASVGDMCSATGWQRHTVRGKVSGTLRRLHGISVATTGSGDGQTYAASWR